MVLECDEEIILSSFHSFSIVESVGSCFPHLQFAIVPSLMLMKSECNLQNVPRSILHNELMCLPHKQSHVLFECGTLNSWVNRERSTHTWNEYVASECATEASDNIIFHISIR